MNLALVAVLLSAHLFPVHGAGVCDATVCYIGGRVTDSNECDRTSENCPVCLVGTSDQAGCVDPSGGWCNQGTDCTGKEPRVAAAEEKDSESGLPTGAIAGVALIAVIAVILFALTANYLPVANGFYTITREGNPQFVERRGNAETSASVPPQSPAVNQYQPPPVNQCQPLSAAFPIAEASPVPRAQPVWQSQV